jgi:hypothetical protein
MERSHILKSEVPNGQPGKQDQCCQVAVVTATFLKCGSKVAVKGLKISNVVVENNSINTNAS